MDSLCLKCKGKGLCGKPCKLLARFVENSPKPTMHFSGPSPPEVFVGRVGYPNVNTGILAPTNFDTKHAELNEAENWSKNNLSIANVLRLRGQLVYGRGQVNVKLNDKLKQVTQELALTNKSVSTEFFLKKKPTTQFTASSVFKPMTNPAPIERVLLQENTKILKKVDYLVNDSDAKSVNAINELYNSNIGVDHLQKLLSVGTLGLKTQRRMVPTRWSITAIDDTISKKLLKKIRYYPQINEILVFSGNYVGNYVEVLFLPGVFTFEAIEMWQDGSVFGTEHSIEYASDYESFHGRKTYATNVTGGYYAMRLPVTEILEKIKRQGTVLVIRKITDEYYAPLGVGIIREATRKALKNPPRKFDSIPQALENIQKRTIKEIPQIKQKSWLLKNYGKQKGLNEFI